MNSSSPLITRTHKVCAKCHIEKPVNEFSISRGKIFSRCKACKAEDRRIAVAANPEKYARYQREYNEKNREKVRKINRDRYRKDPNYLKDYNRARYAINPEKRRVQKAVYAAIRNGRLIKQPCVVCGDPNSEAHHPDYSKPLDVIWMCPRHHQRLHHQEVIKFELEFSHKLAPHDAQYASCAVLPEGKSRE